MNLSVKNLQKKITIDKTFFLSFLKRLCLKLNLAKRSEISIVIVDNKKMQKFNNSYLSRNFPTDVLSFTLSKQKNKTRISIIGDIIINAEYALYYAPSYKNTLRQEMCLYIIHGVLHLIGYNDLKPKDKKHMHYLQLKLLKRLLQNKRYDTKK